MLFSEPKIPQDRRRVRLRFLPSFSALQRAENSSFATALVVQIWNTQFQCSSASRKFLMDVKGSHKIIEKCFSALQRAENSSSDQTQSALRRQSRVSVLFSEPKIPQSTSTGVIARVRVTFQCSSASRKFLNSRGRSTRQRTPRVSVLFSEPKIPQCSASSGTSSSTIVSVLFSEPKIPQSLAIALIGRGGCWFQCSSASRKFLITAVAQFAWNQISFSALQRAENSSITLTATPTSARISCFSALQRAENSSIDPVLAARWAYVSFSALQRAENSSTASAGGYAGQSVRFSALQRAENSSQRGDERRARAGAFVSVLFSEPKIPQSGWTRVFWRRSGMFQCSSASRKFLCRCQRAEGDLIQMFQCSSASRKFLNSRDKPLRRPYALFQCSSASRKFLTAPAATSRTFGRGFSALQRAENSS